MPEFTVRVVLGLGFGDNKLICGDKTTEGRTKERLRKG